MGAWANVSVKGVDTAVDTGWGWWGLAGAKAVKYKFTGTAVADTVTALPPLTAGPLAKFGGPITRGIIWPPLALSSTGLLGSTAIANMSGSSNQGIAGYGCDMAVDAATVAAGGGTATATADASDPWEAEYRHQPGRKSYLLITVNADFSLVPASGKSAFELSGSFGKISLSLDGSDNRASANVNVDPDWLVYEDVKYPTIGNHIRAPHRLLGKQDHENLLLQQHDASTPIWQWTNPAPTLTFVKEVPHTVAKETVEVSIGVTDENANDGSSEDDRQYRVSGQFLR